MRVKIPEKILASVSPCKIFYDEPMSTHTAIGTGGKAAALIIPDSISELRFILDELRTFKNYVVIGNGGDVLVSDGGYGGIIIKTSEIKGIERYGKYLTVSAGERLRDVAEAAHKNGLSGMEWASAYNGTLGAAIFANVSCFGFKMTDNVYVTEVLTKSGEVLVLKRKDLTTQSNKPEIAKKRHIVLRAILQLKRDDTLHIGRRSEKYRNNQKRPAGFAVAGDVFSSGSRLDASRLIRECGFAGKAVGGAFVCADNPNNIINDGGASASDVYSLLNEIMFAVLEKKGVQLKLNMRLIGNF